jgi:hypothetical protein
MYGDEPLNADFEITLQRSVYGYYLVTLVNEVKLLFPRSKRSFRGGARWLALHAEAVQNELYWDL